MRRRGEGRGNGSGGATRFAWAAVAVVLGAVVPARAQDGPCCLPAGGCVETDLYSCAAVGGQFLAGTTCDACAMSVGGCCLPGNCLLLRADQSSSCPAIGGTWLGAGTSCVDCLETPATCVPDAGSCFRTDDVPGCDNETCCTVVCAVDAFCCSTAWDESCVTLSAELCGLDPDSIETELLNTNVRRGVQLSGTVQDLTASDNQRIRVRSEVLPDEPVRHVVDLRIIAVSPFQNVSRLDVLTEAGASKDDVETRIFLRNFAAGRWRRIDRYVQSTTDTQRIIYDVSNPERFINADGRILLRILMRRETTFVGRFDQAAVIVVESPGP